MLDPSAKTPQGRPRDPDVDRRIEFAAQSVLAEGGYAALTVEAVARRAGVARTTVYRRHPSRLALAFASLVHPPRLGPPPDTGSLPSDLVAICEQVTTALTQPGAAAAVAAVIAEADRGPDGDAVRASIAAAERPWVESVLGRARERGELVVEVTAEELTDLLAGALVYRLLVRGAEAPRCDRLPLLLAKAFTTRDEEGMDDARRLAASTA